VPGADVEAVEAPAPAAGRLAEVVEVAGGAVGLVVVVAWRRAGPGLEPPPGPVVGAAELGQGAVLVLVVAQRQHHGRVQVGQQPGDRAHVAGVGRSPAAAVVGAGRVAGDVAGRRDHLGRAGLGGIGPRRPLGGGAGGEPGRFTARPRRVARRGAARRGRGPGRQARHGQGEPGGEAGRGHPARPAQESVGGRRWGGGSWRPGEARASHGLLRVPGASGAAAEGEPATPSQVGAGQRRERANPVRRFRAHRRTCDRKLPHRQRAIWPPARGPPMAAPVRGGGQRPKRGARDPTPDRGLLRSPS
jgi:hypothetical protein